MGWQRRKVGSAATSSSTGRAVVSKVSILVPHALGFVHVVHCSFLLNVSPGRRRSYGAKFKLRVIEYTMENGIQAARRQFFRAKILSRTDANPQQNSGR